MHGRRAADTRPPLADRRRKARTPAKILVGRVGSSYRTDTQLEFREDHAAAVDAVHAEIHLERDLGRAFVERWGLFEVSTQARSKGEFLLRPDYGRRLDGRAAEALKHCPHGVDLQVVIGDGLSAAAVVAQVPELLPMLSDGAMERGWSFGQPFFVRRCRVGAMNDMGDLLGPTVLVLLIGERPGLATAESLSAYLAYHPAAGQNDAHRNLISNIHARGTATGRGCRPHTPARGTDDPSPARWGCDQGGAPRLGILDSLPRRDGR